VGFFCFVVLRLLLYRETCGGAARVETFAVARAVGVSPVGHPELALSLHLSSSFFFAVITGLAAGDRVLWRLLPLLVGVVRFYNRSHAWRVFGVVWTP
jgi:hypothetical protein